MKLKLQYFFWLFQQKSSKNKKRKCDENLDLVKTSVDTTAEESKQTGEVKVTTEEEENRPPAEEKSQEEMTGDDTTDQVCVCHKWSVFF